MYENPLYRKVKGSRPLLISCAHCQNPICLYRKVGKGNLLRLYTDRIVKSALNLEHNALICPCCGQLLGTKVTLPTGKDGYILVRGSVHKREGGREERIQSPR